MNVDEKTELFLMQTRGNVAAAFIYSGVSPTPEQWRYLRGEIEGTLRMIGEIGYATKMNMHLDVVRNQHLEGDGE